MRKVIVMFVILAGIVLGNDMIVRVYAPSWEALKKISAKYELDIAGASAGEWYDIVADKDMLNKIIASGFAYEVTVHSIAALKDEVRAAYLSYDQITDSLQQMAANYPSICKFDSLPITTYEGRWIYGIKISDNPDIEEDDEPGFLIDGQHHAREWACHVTIFFFADSILSSYGVVSEITDIINTTEIYCFPVINVDGFVYDYPSQHNWRKNREPFGGSIGTDCNRNYPGCAPDIEGDWGAVDEGQAAHRPSNILFCGAYANSGDETRALTLYAKSHTINAYMTYHSYGESLMWPWGWTGDPAPDDALHASVGNTMADMIDRLGSGTYDRGPIYSAIYPLSGSSLDWFYSWCHWVEGISNLSYTTELGTTFYQPQGDLDEMMHENFDALLYLADFCDSIVILSEGVVPPPEIYPIDTVFTDFTLYWHAKNTDDNHPIQWELVELSNPSVIEDDLESGTGRWLLDGFTLSTTRAHSGTHSFFSGNLHDMNHAVRTTYPYVVQSGDSVTFWCWYDLEDDYDVAVVEVSENTKEWFNLDTTRFTGNQSSWTRKAYSLEDWVGKSIYIRFRSMTDTYTLGDGFYVDDIAPTCLYNAVDTISSIISDTFYAFTDHPEGDFYYYAKGYNTTCGWGDYSCLELVTVAYEVPPASPYIYNTKSGNAVVITWNKILTDTLGNPTTVDCYAVYRDTLPSFIVGPADSIGYVIHPDTTFTDAGALNDTASFYYLVLAVDEAGNKSKKSNMGYKFSKFLNENDNATDKNLVSLPWPCGYDTVSDLTDDLSAEGDPLVKITNLRDDQSYENWSFTTVPIPRWTGTNFAIIPGDAYEMVTIKDTNLVLVGSNDPDGLVTLNENPGGPDKDWVSIPYNTIYETVSDITDEYSPLGDPLAKLTNLRDDQLYESWSFTTVPFSRWTGTNFPNDRGRGYEFVTTHDTTWNPTEYSNEAFCGGQQVVNIIPHTSDAQVHVGTLTEPDRKPLWLTNDGNYVSATLKVKDNYREAGVSHLVRGYFQLRGCEDIVFSVYRPDRPYDVLTENMVGGGFVIDDDYALFWFDVGNFRKPWQEDDEVALIIGASQSDRWYFTDVNFDLDKTVDIQELGRLSFVPTAQGPQNGRATQVPVDYAFNIYPNPLVEQTRIDFALPQKAEVEMILYDVSGRQVKTLVSKLHKAGYYTISWNGLDDRGRTVPSGVYFVKFEAGGYRVQEKILVVK